ncbi:NADPH-dependent FMN reductase [Sphingobacterium lactis]|uniref:NADPH-dependent FMN reductase n=1 Tax=Sphingobacterium lactis TaxID=797291 RepID=UPI003DA1E0D6
MVKKKILIIIGSASKNSSNLRLMENFIALTGDGFECRIMDSLTSLPHFDPELAVDHTPKSISTIRALIEDSDGVIICTPEYIFSIPSGLKNLLEWCVSTTVFSDKPIGIITASAQGEKGHEELQLIMRILMAKFHPENTWLIQGIKGKINAEGEIIDDQIRMALADFINNYDILLAEN